MAKHFFVEMEKIKKQILSLSALVEENVHKAVKALNTRDRQLAQEVIAADHEVDHWEVEMEEECLKVMALHQPVAVDLRFLISVLKINNDLERVSDLAVHIANNAYYLASHPEISIPVDYSEMADLTQSMLKQSLDAFVNLDAKLAREVCAKDDQVDNMKREIKEYLREHLNNEFHLAERFFSVSRNLERIADMATNISEDVVYMVEGKIVRHQGASA